MTQHTGAERCFSLSGLNGSNPLAFMAALGMLRAAGGGASLCWSRQHVPILRVNEGSTDRMSVCRRVADYIRDAKTALDGYPSPKEKEPKEGKKKASPTANRATIIKVLGKEFRSYAEESLGNELRAAFTASFGSDGVRDITDSDVIAPTRLSLANGNGNKLLLGHFCDMVSAASDALPMSPSVKTHNKGHPLAPSLATLVYEAIFEWRPRSARSYYSFRWDPRELRRFAHMDRNPSDTDNKYEPVPAANLLAVVGLTLLPSVPTRNGLRTTCLFDWGNRELFAWPIWTSPLTLDVTVSLLCHPGEDKKIFAPDWNDAVGVFARFAVERYSDPQKNAYFDISFSV